MEEQNVIAAQASTAAVRPMSFMEKLTNVFAAPGELYENVRLTPTTASNWVIPLLIFIVVSFLANQLVLNNASLADQIGAAYRETLDKAVAEGKMAQERADQAYEMMKPGSVVSMIGQVVSLVVFTPLVLFATSLIYWLLGKSVMRANTPYLKVVEVAGLSLFIGVLEVIVTTLLMYATGSIHATPSLGAFVPDFRFDNKVHVLLSKVNIFTFWSLAVISIGLAKLFQRHLPKVLVLLFALWALWTLFTVILGFGLG